MRTLLLEVNAANQAVYARMVRACGIVVDLDLGRFLGTARQIDSLATFSVDQQLGRILDEKNLFSFGRLKHDFCLRGALQLDEISHKLRFVDDGTDRFHRLFAADERWPGIGFRELLGWNGRAGARILDKTQNLVRTFSIIGFG